MVHHLNDGMFGINLTIICPQEDLQQRHNEGSAKHDEAGAALHVWRDFQNQRRSSSGSGGSTHQAAQSVGRAEGKHLGWDERHERHERHAIIAPLTLTA